MLPLVAPVAVAEVVVVRVAEVVVPLAPLVLRLPVLALLAQVRCQPLLPLRRAVAPVPALLPVRLLVKAHLAAVAARVPVAPVADAERLRLRVHSLQRADCWSWPSMANRSFQRNSAQSAVALRVKKTPLTSRGVFFDQILC